MYYDIAIYSVSFTAQQLCYTIATYAVYDSVGSPCLYSNGAGLPAHGVFDYFFSDNSSSRSAILLLTWENC